MKEIVWGITFVTLGIIFVVYARKFVEWFGTMATAERYLGSGGTYTALRIIGILSTMVGILLVFGLLDNMFLAILKTIGLSK